MALLFLEVASLHLSRLMQKTVTKMKKTELLKKYVETHYYIQKPLVQRLREDWHPPPEVYEFVEKNPPPKELMEAFRKMADLPMEQQIAGCKLIFDPRVERLPF